MKKSVCVYEDERVEWGQICRNDPQEWKLFGGGGVGGRKGVEMRWCVLVLACLLACFLPFPGVQGTDGDCFRE